MRKLLVASQKSGVGKTTTAINLAAGAALAGGRVLLVETDPLNNLGGALNLVQHPQRKPLREAGIELPGVICCDVIPGLDVLSPYEEGSCSDEDLDRLLQLVSLDAFAESYDCLLVNAPPFFGGRPGPLLACADEFLVVMQAEPLAYRTMPAFLEMVQRASRAEKHAAKMRGVLLTIPETETVGGRWERELRGRFGGRVLGPVIPYDPEVGKSSLFGQVALHATPEAPGALAFQEVVSELQLAGAARKASRALDATLTLVAAAVRANPPVPRPAPAPVARKSSARLPRVMVPAGAPAGPRRTAPPRTAPPPEGRTPASTPPVLPPPSPRRAEAARTAPPPRYAPVARRIPDPVPPPLHSTPRPWYVWGGLGMVGGIGLRFVELPSYALPIIVGVAVAAGVTLMLHLATHPHHPRR